MVDLVGDSGERRGGGGGGCGGGGKDGDTFRFCWWEEDFLLFCFPSRSGLGDNVRWLLFHSLLFDRLDEAEC